VSDAIDTTHLGPDYVAATVEKLQARIHARFPDRNLGVVAGELRSTVVRIKQQFADVQDRHRRITSVARAASVVVLVAALAALVLSLVNDLVFAAVAVYFLWAVPERLQRRTVLALLHQLRSLAHVIDMHQLDKDPEQVKPDYHPTPKSPPHHLDAAQLHHYFDYCSELLSLVAKTAALCAEHTSDAVVLGTVSDLETLTAELSQKIWAKISLLPT
jgi:hypothetical protein